MRRHSESKRTMPRCSTGVPRLPISDPWMQWRTWRQNSKSGIFHDNRQSCFLGFYELPKLETTTPKTRLQTAISGALALKVTTTNISFGSMVVLEEYLHRRTYF